MSKANKDVQSSVTWAQAGNKMQMEVCCHAKATFTAISDIACEVSTSMEAAR